jgi:hypothetical protein
VVIVVKIAGGNFPVIGVNNHDAVRAAGFGVFCQFDRFVSGGITPINTGTRPPTASIAASAKSILCLAFI